MKLLTYPIDKYGHPHPEWPVGEADFDDDNSLSEHTNRHLQGESNDEDTVMWVDASEDYRRSMSPFSQSTSPDVESNIDEELPPRYEQLVA